jgi:hypothetical protein
MTLFDLRDLLLTVGPPVYHYHAHQQPDSYIVWAEYGGSKLGADSRGQEKAARVQVDLFTRTEFDSNVETITALLDQDDIAASEPLTDYEPDTGYIHHIWDCNVA